MKKRTVSLLGLCTAITLACGSAPTRMYTLQPVAPRGAPVGYAGPPVRVAAVHLPAELDRTEVVTELAGGQVRINDLDHWAAPIGKLAQQALTADLVARLPAGKVAYPGLSPDGTVAEMRVDILRVSSGSGSRLTASWQLTLDRHANHSGTVDLQATVANSGAVETANGLSALLGQLADSIAGSLSTSASANSNP